MAVAIREILVRLVAQLLNRRDLSVEGGVAHPGRRERRVGTERQIFGHALGEPQRRQELHERLQTVAGFAPCEDVVLERVHHFVREHVLEALVVAGEIEEHPVTRRLRYAPRALAEIAGDVVLSEVRPR